MFTKRASNIRGVALIVIFILVLLLVVIGFVILSLDLFNARHIFASIGLHWNNTDEIHTQNKLEHENDLQYEELASSYNDEEPLHTTEWPSEARTQDHFSSEYGSSSITTSVPKLSSPSPSFTVSVRMISSATAIHQSQSDSFIESPNNDRSIIDESIYENQNTAYQSDPEFTRIVDNFVDMLLEENNITTDSVTPETTTDLSLMDTSTTVADFSRQAVILDEDLRAFQRISYKPKIRYFSRFTNLVIPIVKSKDNSTTTTAIPSIQNATSAKPAYIRAYEIPNVKKHEVIVKLTKEPKMEIIEAITSSKNTSTPVVTELRTADTTFKSSPVTAAPKHTPTIAICEHFKWSRNEASDGSDNQAESVLTLTTTHASAIPKRSNSEFDSAVGKGPPNRPLDHPISISRSSVSSADEEDQKSSVWREFSHTYSNVTSVTKPQESSDLNEHLNTRRPLVNGHSHPSMRPIELTNSVGSVDNGPKPSKQKPLPNAKDDSLSWLQKQLNHSAENRLQFHHSRHQHHKSTEINQRLTPQVINTYSNHPHMSEIIPNVAKYPQIHQRDDSRTPSPIPFINHHKPVATSTLTENDLSQKISTFPWMAPFSAIESKGGIDQHAAFKATESLDDSTSSSGDFIAVKVANPFIIPDLPTGYSTSPPSTVSLPSVQKNSLPNENVFDAKTSKVIDEQSSDPSNIDHPVDEIDSVFDAIEIYPHTFTIPTEHKKHPHRHKHQYNRDSPIIVTALIDIGRGKWTKYTRTYTQYMNYLENLLTLNNRMVIFTDRIGAEFIRRKRHSTNTEIFEITIRNIPLYRYRDEMEQILTLEQREWKYDQRTKDKPESKSADYDVLVNSKAYFLYNATQSSKFRASAIYYAWIDAGYGHGDQNVIPLYCHWKPTFLDGFITVIKLTPEHDKISRYSINDLYRVDWSVVSGGFLAGDSTTIYRFYRFYKKTFLDLLDEKKVDDDQTVLTLTMKNYASLFNIIHSNGDWFALFRLFPCMK